MDACPNLEDCGFIKKFYGARTAAVKGYMKIYCKGEWQNRCKRKEHKLKTGSMPSDEMLPNGRYLKN
ncbi:MAG: hypothetical protein N3I35_10850 [Clostridia bacterium]|nr:hypothetical protein [Clostridia bacterium]